MPRWARLETTLRGGLAASLFALCGCADEGSPSTESADSTPSSTPDEGSRFPSSAARGGVLEFVCRRADDGPLTEDFELRFASMPEAPPYTGADDPGLVFTVAHRGAEGSTVTIPIEGAPVRVRVEARDGDWFAVHDLDAPDERPLEARTLVLEKDVGLEFRIDDGTVPRAAVPVALHARLDAALCGKSPDPVLARAVSDANGIARFPTAAAYARGFLRSMRRFGSGTVYLSAEVPEATPRALPIDPFAPPANDVSPPRFLVPRTSLLMVEILSNSGALGATGTLRLELDPAAHRPGADFCASPIRVERRFEGEALRFEVPPASELVLRVLPDSPRLVPVSRWITSAAAVGEEVAVRLELAECEESPWLLGNAGGEPLRDLVIELTGADGERLLVDAAHRRTDSDGRWWAPVSRERLVEDRARLWVRHDDGLDFLDASELPSDPALPCTLSRSAAVSTIEVRDEQGELLAGCFAEVDGALLRRAGPGRFELHRSAAVTRPPNLTVLAPGFELHGPGSEIGFGVLRTEATEPLPDRWDFVAVPLAAAHGTLLLPEGVSAEDLTFVIEGRSSHEFRIDRPSESSFVVLAPAGEHELVVEVRSFPGESFVELHRSSTGVLRAGRRVEAEKWRAIDLRDSLGTLELRLVDEDGAPVRDAELVAVKDGRSLGPPTLPFDRTGRFRALVTLDKVECTIGAPGAGIVSRTWTAQERGRRLELVLPRAPASCEVRRPELPSELPEHLLLIATLSAGDDLPPAERQLERSLLRRAAFDFDPNGIARATLPSTRSYRVSLALLDQRSGRRREIGAAVPVAPGERVTPPVDENALRAALAGR